MAYFVIAFILLEDTLCDFGALAFYHELTFLRLSYTHTLDGIVFRSSIAIYEIFNDTALFKKGIDSYLHGLGAAFKFHLDRSTLCRNQPSLVELYNLVNPKINWHVCYFAGHYD